MLMKPTALNRMKEKIPYNPPTRCCHPESRTCASVMWNQWISSRYKITILVPTEEDTDDEDSMINSSSDDSILRTRATCFLSSLVPHFWPCSKSIRDDYEDDISLEDITSYLHPGAHEYVDEDLEELNASILQKTQSLYILQDKTSTPDKLFTGVLIASTAIAILVLFIYQNFGSGNLGKRHQ
ncbi:unnamed protein product [Lepeophtheirus salmonis]|uniref:(salmon louse) hypothetical protein n=1 Tax=Lepeophtheirus salmonis TaxID=72036 RepID=A0A7R8CBK4_LEPSM|nr:unnamed protein product [Lepeophtheirus salmonis]CAF2761510.1 unnamed protein product [Lepeophtheirus salmonis]